jgi:DNA modification methylase
METLSRDVYRIHAPVFYLHDRERKVVEKSVSPPDGTLYYGDNLDILRNEIKSETVDLVYLDPPFNSNATYNILFSSPEGEESHAQIAAFEDTWHWNEHAERAFEEVLRSGNTDVSEMLRAMRSFLKENDMMAYLTMMAVRLIELHRVLKPTGSLYLHCDPTASHYLKLLLDAIFGKKNFRREIIWRSGWVSGFKTAAKNWVRNHDVIFYYVKDEQSEYYFELPRRPHPPGYKRRGGGENPAGVALDDVWTDIYSPGIMSFSKEKLGYPTQKPVALLERILTASTREGDIVLDPFCGCGTTIHAAQKLKRQWIGIDITHLAISLIEKRLRDAFPEIKFDVHGVPKDLESARALADQDKYQFQWWAVSLVNAVPYGGKKKGADTGIDGHIYFMPDGKTSEKAIVSVKGGESVGVSMIRDLAHVVDREQAKIGVFITLAEPTGPMKTEAVKAGFYETPFHGKVPKIQILTIEELFAGKLPNIPFRDETVFRKADREEDQTEHPTLL